MICTALYALTLLSLMHGLSLIPDTAGAYLMALAGAITLVFFRCELGHSNSVLRISIFRKNTVFTFSNLAALINYSATFAVGFILSLYLQYMKDFSPEAAGVILISQPIVQAVFSPPGRKALG